MQPIPNPPTDGRQEVPVDRPAKRRPWLRVFVGLAVSGILLLGGAIGWVATHEDEIEAAVLAEVEKSLRADAHIGDMDVSWWHDFPRITVGLEGVWLAGSGEALTEAGLGDTLLRAERVGLAFDLLQLLQGDYVLQGLSLEDGRLALAERQGGVWNWDVWETDSTAAGVDRWAIERLALERMEVSVDAESIWVEALLCRGAWENQNFQADLKGQILPQTDFLKPEAPMCALEGEVRYDGVLGRTEWVLNDAQWAGIAVQGNAVWAEDSDPVWSVDFEGVSSEAIGWVAGLPEAVAEWEWAGRLEGRAAGANGLAEGEVRMRNADFQWSPEKGWDGFRIRELEGTAGFSATWTYSAEKSLQWKARQVLWEVPGLWVEGNASGRGWENPQFQFQGQIRADRTPLSQWLDFPETWGQALPSEGRIEFDGSLQFKQGTWLPPKGSWKLQELRGDWMGADWTLDAAGSTAAGDLNIDNGALHWGSSAGTLSGVWREAWGWTPESGLQAQLVADFGTLDLRPWAPVAGDSVPATTDPGPDSTAAGLGFPAFASGHDIELRLDAATVLWGEQSATRCRLFAQVQGAQWTVSRLDFDFASGRVSSDWAGSAASDGITLQGHYRLDGVDLPTLFRGFDNFDQTTLRHEHLEGKLTASGQIQLGYSPSTGWQNDALAGHAQITIDQGVLRGVEAFEDIVAELRKNRLMAPWVDPDDLASRLKNIRLERVESQVQFQGSTLSFPPTPLNSSAMNIVLSGDHICAGRIDYTLGFTLRDLRNARQDKIGEVADDGLGNVLFVRMTGTLDEPEYLWDREAQKRFRQAAWDAEKAQIQSLFRKNAP